MYLIDSRRVFLFPIAEMGVIQTQVLEKNQEVESETNQAGLTIQDYKCPECGYTHFTSYVNNAVLTRCLKCHYRFPKVIRPAPWAYRPQFKR